MTTQTWPDVLTTVVGRSDLSVEQTRWAMGQILAGEATPAQVAGFAVALRSKGETVDEDVGLVEAMFEKAAPLSIPGRRLYILCTGGDRSFSVNLPPLSAIVAADSASPFLTH